MTATLSLSHSVTQSLPLELKLCHTDRLLRKTCSDKGRVRKEKRTIQGLSDTRDKNKLKKLNAAEGEVSVCVCACVCVRVCVVGLPPAFLSPSLSDISVSIFDSLGE